MASTVRHARAGLTPCVARAYAIPGLGYLLRILVAIAKLPRLNAELRRHDALLRELRSEFAARPPHDRRLEVLADEFPRVLEAVTATQTALRVLRRGMPPAGPPQAGAAPVPQAAWIDPQIEVVAETRLRREQPLGRNRLPRLSDWSVGSALSLRMAGLREPHTVHRKSWEYAICIDGLEAMGVVRPEATAIAVGAGTERPLYYFANVIETMIATDLYDNPAHEGDPAMLTDPGRFAPFPYRHASLQVRRMAGDALDFPAGHFDFAFCLSSIEHFGARAVQRRAFDEMARVVRPGGAVCLITELILNGERHPEYFLPAEIQEMFLEHPQLRLDGPPPELRISDVLLSCPIDIRVDADRAASPHIVLTDGRVVWTSLSLFFRKSP